MTRNEFNEWADEYISNSGIGEEGYGDLYTEQVYRDVVVQARIYFPEAEAEEILDELGIYICR